MLHGARADGHSPLGVQSSRRACAGEPHRRPERHHPRRRRRRDGPGRQRRDPLPQARRGTGAPVRGPLQRRRLAAARPGRRRAALRSDVPGDRRGRRRPAVGRVGGAVGRHRPGNPLPADVIRTRPRRSDLHAGPADRPERHRRRQRRLPIARDGAERGRLRRLPGGDQLARQQPHGRPAAGRRRADQRPRRPLQRPGRAMDLTGLHQQPPRTHHAPSERDERAGHRRRSERQRRGGMAGTQLQRSGCRSSPGASSAGASAMPCR